MTENDEAREAQIGTTGPSDLPAPPWADSAGHVAAVPGGEKVKRSPSAWWYLLCLGVLIAGFVVVVVGVVNAATSIGDNFSTFEGPGTQEVVIKDAGNQSIYLETTSGGDTGAVTIKITGENGEEISTGPSTGSATYSINSREGRRVAMVDIPTAGTYTISSSRFNESPEPYKLQIGTIGVGAFVTAIVVPSALSILLAVVVFVAIFLMRRRTPLSG